MSKNANYSGKTIVADRVIELAGTSASELDILGLQVGSTAQKYTEAQAQFARDYSITIQGSSEVSSKASANLSVKVYRKGRLQEHGESLENSNVTWILTSKNFQNKTGKYKENKDLILTMNELSSAYSTLTCVWTSTDENAVPIVASVNVTLGKVYQYVSTPYSRQNEVLNIMDGLWSYEKITTPKNQGEYIWYRTSDDYNFITKRYQNWEYFKNSTYFDSTGWEGTEEEWLNNMVPEGKSYTVIILSDNGAIFRFPMVDTTLRCQVLCNNDDITTELEDWRFMWKRISGDSLEDERWNSQTKAIGKKYVDITEEDCLGRTVFTCEVDI